MKKTTEGKSFHGGMSRKDWFYLTHLQTVNLIHLNKVLEEIDCPLNIFSCSDQSLYEMGFTEEENCKIRYWSGRRKESDEEYERMCGSGLLFTAQNDPEYPEKLYQLKDRPLSLFYYGKLPDSQRPAAAIVGARACSAYGKECASWFARELASMGVCIISGMAFGIDTAAHKAAMKEKGGTLAVLGGGADQCYPKEHYEIYEALKETNGLCSEMLPGTASRSFLFPRRNRIISGLSDIVLVVEAREKSGSLITADFAAEQGRLVYAIPGTLGNGLSAGCHQLIRNGAILASKPEDILEDLHMQMEANLVTEFQTGVEPLTEGESIICGYLNREPKAMEIILEESGFLSGDLAFILLQLEIKGYVIQEPRNYYRRSNLSVKKRR